MQECNKESDWRTVCEKLWTWATTSKHEWMRERERESVWERTRGAEKAENMCVRAVRARECETRRRRIIPAILCSVIWNTRNKISFLCISLIWLVLLPIFVAIETVHMTNFDWCTYTHYLCYNHHQQFALQKYIENKFINRIYFLMRTYWIHSL